MDETCCKTCKFFFQEFGEGYGTCHRYAPHPISKGLIPHGNDDENTFDSYWAAVNDTDWCGDYQRNEVL